MNSSGFIRGIMSKNLSNEAFVLRVGQTIEDQLKEWDEAYCVNIMKMKDYIFVVKHGEKDYWLEMTEEELAKIQDQSPYSLDAKIWLELERQGVAIQLGCGNYLGKALEGRD